MDTVAADASAARRPVVLALGSNLGDSLTILQGAIDDLSGVEGLDVTAASGVYETDPVGGPEQRPYLNAVVLGSTSLSGLELLAVTQGVEQAWHRTREVRWGPRTLDIDVISVGEETSADADLTLPHPRAHERGFVLVPWFAVDPEATLVGQGTVRDLIAGIDVAGVRETTHRLLVPAVAGD